MWLKNQGFFFKQQLNLASDSVLELHSEEEDDNSSAFLPKFIDFPMMFHDCELLNYISSDCSQVSGSLLTLG